VTTFIDTTHPFLRILMTDGTYVQFQAGHLEVAENDKYHKQVMAEAARNPSISVMVNETTCRFCGEVFTGDKAAAKLEAHTKAMHFDLWQKQRDVEAATVVQREIKARAGYACDVCAPVQTFGSPEQLAEHVTLLHAAPPELDAAGNTRGGDPDESRRPGEVAPPAAARPSRRGPDQ
jgi:hypothetical protein